MFTIPKLAIVASTAFLGSTIPYQQADLKMTSPLTGCFGWDEAAERGSCEKAYPSDKAKADECYSLNKAMYDKDPDRR
jgi:hypothetical protein